MHFTILSHRVSLDLTSIFFNLTEEAPKLEYQNLVQVYTPKYRSKTTDRSHSQT